ncbi:MAG: hypothetical protein WCJ19_04760 [bacterium]
MMGSALVTGTNNLKNPSACSGNTQGASFTIKNSAGQSLQLSAGPIAYSSINASMMGGACTNSHIESRTANIDGTNKTFEFKYMDNESSPKAVVDCYGLPMLLAGKNSRWVKFYMHTEGMTAGNLDTMFDVIKSIKYPNEK